MLQVITGWKVAPDERRRLLERFPPRYERAIVDHVTYRYGAAANAPAPEQTGGEIVGEADDGRGVQALVVRIGGTTERGDGSHFHITWSLGKGRRAKESNEVIAAGGWRPISPPVPVGLHPQRWQG